MHFAFVLCWPSTCCCQHTIVGYKEVPPVLLGWYSWSFISLPSLGETLIVLSTSKPECSPVLAENHSTCSSGRGCPPLSWKIFPVFPSGIEDIIQFPVWARKIYLSCSGFLYMGELLTPSFSCLTYTPMDCWWCVAAWPEDETVKNLGGVCSVVWYGNNDIGCFDFHTLYLFLCGWLQLPSNISNRCWVESHLESWLAFWRERFT